MTLAFKTFLLWLLIACVPLQAIGAVAGMSCGPAHPATSMSQKTDHARKLADDVVADHQHHAVPASSVSDRADASSEMQDNAPHVKCSACSAFCIGAVAPPPALNAMIAPAGSETVLIIRPDIVIEFNPEGRKRPPRLIFP